jgi:hypothetical protein
MKDRLNTVFSRMEQIRTQARQFDLFNEPAFRQEYGDCLLEHLATMEKRIAEERENARITETESEAMKVTLASLRHDFSR